MHRMKRDFEDWVEFFKDFKVRVEADLMYRFKHSAFSGRKLINDFKLVVGVALALMGVAVGVGLFICFLVWWLQFPLIPSGF